MTLRLLRTHAELLEATHGSAFVRYDIPEDLERPGHGLGEAVALPRRTHTRRLGLVVMGPPADVEELVGAVVAEGVLGDTVRSVTVQRGSLEAVAAHLELGDGNEWEWMCTTTPPPVVPGESRLTPLSQEDLGDICGLQEVAHPHTDARPFEFPGQQWVGVRDEDGRLVACGVSEPSLAGWPILSGITVHPGARGTGLGLAVTAHLTRAAVADRGVCTLGMYSHNAVARRLYIGLGYGQVHEWSSRRLAAAPVRA